MRTDPRKGCANEKELLGWAILHDLVAHPFMVLTGYSRLSLRLHDYTSHKAWPRASTPAPRVWRIPTVRFGLLAVTEIQPPGCYSVRHGLILHTLRVKAIDELDAVRQAEEWFATLVDLIPHSAAA
ncbi:hypothetical protein [Achromobacter pestifer]|uniref:Uncharacterized protein n=1 Tax=Achromobacter pestifer TaxID=1353889 RepID=A0A6S6ZG58_9BURK|nr:hypothetical protein [Achromobacter pestifer]CAB3624540.1 hypothetical protein LMG3431_00031 [Achromobacter pestifer]